MEDMLPPVPYDEVTASDLEIIREPRKSRIRVKHIPTATVGDNAVTPTEHAPARFRRPSTLPKENRATNMIGYVEGQTDDDKGIWVITEGDNATNEYLEALAADKEALRLTFEGSPAEEKENADAERQPVPSPEPPEAVIQGNGEPEVPTEVEIPEPVAPTAEPVPEPIDKNDMQEIDDLLAGLEET